MEQSPWHCERVGFQARYYGRDTQINDILSFGEVKDLRWLLKERLHNMIDALENPDNKNWERILFELKTSRGDSEGEEPLVPLG